MEPSALLAACGWKPGTPEAQLATDAYEFARRAHSGQMRCDGRPVWEHVLAVVGTLVSEVGERSPEAVTAALLHDAVESGGATEAAISARFGPGVGGLVAALTRPDVHSAGAFVSSEYTARVAAAGPVAVTIKICDRIDGLRGVHGRPAPASGQFVADTRCEYLKLARHGAAAAARLLEAELAKLAGGAQAAGRERSQS